MVGEIRQFFDTNQEVRIIPIRTKNGKYLWVARDAKTYKHVCVGPIKFNSYEEAEEHGMAYMNVRGE